MRQAVLVDQRGGGRADGAVQLTAEVAVACAPVASAAGKGGRRGMRLGGVLIVVAGAGAGRHGDHVGPVQTRVRHLVRGDRLRAMVRLGHPVTLRTTKERPSKP